MTTAAAYVPPFPCDTSKLPKFTAEPQQPRTLTYADMPIEVETYFARVLYRHRAYDSRMKSIFLDYSRTCKRINALINVASEKCAAEAPEKRHQWRLESGWTLVDPKHLFDHLTLNDRSDVDYKYIIDIHNPYYLVVDEVTVEKLAHSRREMITPLDFDKEDSTNIASIGGGIDGANCRVKYKTLPFLGDVVPTIQENNLARYDRPLYFKRWGDPETIGHLLKLLMVPTRLDRRKGTICHVKFKFKYNTATRELHVSVIKLEHGRQLLFIYKVGDDNSCKSLGNLRIYCKKDD